MDKTTSAAFHVHFHLKWRKYVNCQGFKLPINLNRLCLAAVFRKLWCSEKGGQVLLQVWDHICYTWMGHWWWRKWGVPLGGALLCQEDKVCFSSQNIPFAFLVTSPSAFISKLRNDISTDQCHWSPLSKQKALARGCCLFCLKSHFHAREVWCKDGRRKGDTLTYPTLI